MCIDCNTFGTIERTNGLGLDYAPVVMLDTGGRRLFCGSKLPDYCQHLPLFCTTLQELGSSQSEIDSFVTHWRQATDRESTRQPLYDGLVTAKATGNTTTITNYINSVKTQIGMS